MLERFKKMESDSLFNGIESMLVNPTLKMSYFGEFFLYVHIIASERCKSIGVSVTTRGPVMIYNPTWVSKNLVTDNMVRFVLIHELLHLHHDHISRTVFGVHEKRASNIVQDAIINQLLCDDDEMRQHIELVPGGVPGIPKEYDGRQIFEELYEFFKDKADKQKYKEGGEGEYNPFGGSPDENGESMDVHMSKEDLEKFKEELKAADIEDAKPMTGDMAQQIIKDIEQTMKNRGLLLGNIEKIIDGLRKTRRNYIKEILGCMSEIMSGTVSEETYKKPNRFGIKFMRGRIRKQSEINVILDTSGSMSNEFELVLSTLYKRQVVINLIQCDTEVKSVKRFEDSGMLNRVEIKGLGGTEISPAIRHVTSDKKLVKLPTVILTDGETDNLETHLFRNRCLILTTGSTPPMTRHVRVIVVNKNND